jgi:Ca-activated chloride channel homolog
MNISAFLMLALVQAPVDGARAVASASPASASAATSAAASNGISVRITSPLGRSGMHGKIRIVAQIRSNDSAPITQVRFLIDQQPYKTDTDGPPYVVEWEDENPFERREIGVEVSDSLGRAATDRVVLEPFDIIEESQVTSVLLEAAVQDTQGRFVKGISPARFSVREDGVLQKLDLVRQEEVGATFALLVDSSASMSRRLDFVQQTAATLVGYMSPLDRMVIAPFSKSVMPVTGPTADRQTILEGIKAIKPGGGTAILNSVSEMSASLGTADGRRAIVLITDGYDEHSTTSIESALAVAKKNQVTVYVIAIGGIAGISLKGERALRALARETGGTSFFPATESQLAAVHGALVDDVQHRYLLTYTPTNQTNDGSWRAITIDCGDAKLRVRTRPGYFAPKPSPIRPNIEFTAIDPEGRYLDVSADDVEVTENGVPQKVEVFQEATQPVSIVLALDNSGSMRQREAQVIDAARGFVSALRPDDKLAVMHFADETDFAHDLGANKGAAQAAIGQYRASGGTALYDAIAESLVRLHHAEGRRVLVVMTDGRDENNAGTGPGSSRRFEDVLRILKDSGTAVFAIGLGTKVDSQPLTTLAELSGGRALFPTDVSSLSVEFGQIVEDLRRRYLVSYTSSHGQHDGSWREVKIQLKSVPGAAVRSAGGYTAPER